MRREEEEEVSMDCGGFDELKHIALFGGESAFIHRNTGQGVV